MIRNYLKIAWRTTTKNKIYSLINILNLTIGLCACMVIATVVIDDLSYDRQWSKGDDLYRIVSVNKMGEDLHDRFASSLTGLGTSLKNDYSEVVTVAQLRILKQQFKLDDKDPNGIEVVALRADTGVWQMLDFKVIQGNPRKYIDGSQNIVITKSFKNRFFPDENPIGKIIYDVPRYSNEASRFLITGVIEDLPSNTVLRSEVILLQKGRNEDLNKKQYGSFSQNYILMKPGTDMKKFTAKVNKWYAGYVEVKNPYQFEFQPMKNIYLHSDFAETLSVKGDYKNVFILSGVAILLLIIACVNFVNLSTARVIYRLKETGVRKVLGAERRQLVFQFLIESFLLFSVATILATTIYQFSLQPIQNFLEHLLSKTLFSSFTFFSIAFGVVLLISLLSGLYPALILSGFKPAVTLKGKLSSGSFSGQNFVRKSLVVLQFSISIFVIVAMIVVQQQVSFMKTKDIGFDKNNLMYIGFVSWEGKGASFKDELLKQQGIVSASITQWTPTSAGYMIREIDDPNHEENTIRVNYIYGDIDLAKTLGLRLKKGRLLDRQFAADTLNLDVIMEMDSATSTVKMKRQSSLITTYTAKLLHVNELNTPIKNALTTPVGIIEDIHSETLKKSIQPTVFTAEDSPTYGGMLVKIKPGFERQVMASLNNTWRQFYPNKLLDIKWVDEMINDEYKAESKLQQLFMFFSSLSMFLAALGVLGLIVQAIAERVKEIGIRKVLGASAVGIVKMLSSDFVKLIFIAVFIASPIAWWAMNQWLKDFAYRIEVQWWMFGMAGVLAIVVAVVTVSFQAIKAAIANPVDSLRDE